MDGRTVNGCKKAQQRSEETHAECSGALLNWVKTVEVAQTLLTADLQKYSDEEVAAMCEAVHGECPDFPPNIQKKLLQKASQKLLAEQGLSCLVQDDVALWGG